MIAGAFYIIKKRIAILLHCEVKRGIQVQS